MSISVHNHMISKMAIIKIPTCHIRFNVSSVMLFSIFRYFLPIYEQSRIFQALLFVKKCSLQSTIMNYIANK